MHIGLISYAGSHQGRRNRAAQSNRRLPSIFQNHKVELAYLLSNHFNPIKGPMLEMLIMDGVEMGWIGCAI